MCVDRCDVVITYCWNRVGYSILRSLASRGLSICVADTSVNNICSISRFCGDSFVYPDPFTRESEFIATLKAKVEELHPSVLLPTHDESQVIMQHREEFPKELIIPYMGAEMLKNVSDKGWATRKAQECGVPTPKVYLRASDVDKFPCVFKTTIGNSAKTVFFPDTKAELDSLVNKFRGVNYLIEEKIGGCDYSVDCIRWDGFFKATTYRALLTKTDGGGTTTQRIIVSEPELEHYAEQLLDYIGYQGVCGIDFRYDPSIKRAAFIEVNARFTGGLATPIAAGFDIPWIVYSLSTSGHYGEPVNVKVGTKTKWILGDIIALVDRLFSLNFDRDVWKQALSFRGFDAFDDYRSDDRRAFWGEMSYYLRKLLRNGKINP